jgi:ADP-heptose:LPS heptosyltransferase
MFPDSSSRRRQWPGFEALSRQLLAQLPQLKLIWCARLPMLPEPPFPDQRFLNLTGCPLAQMITLLEYDTLVVGNNSGPLHLAAALQRRVVGIFDAAGVRRFGPYPAADQRNRVVVAAQGGLQDLAVGPVLAAVLALVQII